MLIEYKVDLIRTFMQVEGEIKLNGTTYNKDGSVEFTGYENNKVVKFAMDKSQVEILKNENDIIGIYEFYKEQEYFNTL